MKRLVLFAVVASLLLTLMIGCSSKDETPTSSDTKETGDLNDPTYQAVETAFVESEAMADELWLWMEGVIDTVFTDSASLAPGKLAGDQVAADTVYMTYHSNTSYWYLYISHDDTVYGQGQEVEDVITFVLRDSVQFRHGATPVQWPDSSLLTAVYNGVLLTVTTQTGTGNLTAAQRVNVTGDIIDRGDVTLNGTRSYDFDFQNQAQNCSVSFDITGTADDVFMNITAMDTDGCPYSGVLSHEGTIGIECTGDTTFSFSDTWLITQTFYGDHYDIVVENSTTRWTSTETCPGGVVTSAVAKMLADFRERR